MDYHKSVLLQEAVNALGVKRDEIYIDGTIGGGGHTGLILLKGGRVLGIDQDQEALSYVQEKYKEEIAHGRLQLVKGNFREIDTLSKHAEVTQVAGILLDIGVSSHHLDSAERGFSFQYDAPLDMRMDLDSTVKAGDLINILTKSELYALFTKLGEERFANKIVHAILNVRKTKKIETTGELAEIIRGAVPFAKKGIHPATKVFQALRIAVNDELHSLEDALPKAVGLLASGGVLGVISFHSLEDRIVKHTFLAMQKKGIGDIVTKKPIVSSEEEVAANPRSRSAKLRVLRKI